MKTTKPDSRIINIVLISFALMFTFIIDSNAKKAKFLPSSVVPAAEGYVKVKKDKNKNYVIQIKIFNFAEVEKLQTSKQTYVVWLETKENETKNIGRLKSSSPLFSKKVGASFETVSPSKPSRIYITDENDGDIQYPGGQIVLTTDQLYK